MGKSYPQRSGNSYGLNKQASPFHVGVEYLSIDEIVEMLKGEVEYLQMIFKTFLSSESPITNAEDTSSQTFSSNQSNELSQSP
jgi:hypothetical protein